MTNKDTKQFYKRYEIIQGNNLALRVVRIGTVLKLMIFQDWNKMEEKDDRIINEKIVKDMYTLNVEVLKYI